MNYSIIRYIISRVLQFQALFMVLPCIISLWYQETAGWSYVRVMVLCFVAGWIGTRKKPQSHVFFAKEGFVTVSLSWMMLSFTGALPFYLSGEIPNLTDAIFESVSGFTTTGASILPDVEALSYCNLMWRSFTHWLGGMGVLVLILAILPLAGGYNMHLMRAESSGPSVEKLVPRVRHTARILYGIYIAMTALLLLLLLLAKMPFFDAAAITFGTAGTGGFAVLGDSMSSYSGAIQLIVTIFMILFGINFNVYYLFLIKKPKEAICHEEMRCYLFLMFLAIVCITINIREQFGSIPEAFHHAAFQVGSLMTSTGFATTDYGLWPQFSQTMLMFTMFLGACAGSTGGGIKISRIVILIKMIKNEVFHLVHPQRVTQVRFGERVIVKEIWRGIQVFLVSYLCIFTISLLLLSLAGFDFMTNFTAIAATLNNTGLGFSQVGPTGSFGIFPDPAKWILIFDMLAGRLEIFPMLVLLAPSTWKRG